MKTCPYCSRVLQDADIICRHCGENIAIRHVAVPEPVSPPPEHKVSGTCLVVIVTLLILLGIFQIMNITQGISF